MAGQIINRGKKTWIVRIYLGTGPDGKRLYENKTVHGNKEAAENYLNAALRARDLGEFDPRAARVRMKELFDLVEADYRLNGKGLKGLEQILRIRLRPTFDNLLAARVTSDTIAKFVASRRALGEPNATINRALAALRRAFNLGRKATPPLVRNRPVISALRESNVRTGFFEPGEFQALRDALPEYMRPLVTAAYFTGCRRGELLALQWHQVDLKRKTIRLNPGETKNSEGRVIPLAADLLAMLKVERERRDLEYPHCDLVFSNAGEPIKNIPAIWKEACTVAGLVDADGNPTRLFHDFRRSGVRNLIRAGVPERVAMAISGHKTRSVFDRYNIVAESDLHEATRKLGAYLEGRKEDVSHTNRTQPEGQPENPHTIRTQGGSEVVQ